MKMRVMVLFDFEVPPETADPENDAKDLEAYARQEPNFKIPQLVAAATSGNHPDLSMQISCGVVA